jgi:hypothetical protein
LLRIVPPAAAMALVLWPFAGDHARLAPMALGAMLSGIVYVMACLATGVWPWSDVMRIWNSVRRPAGQAMLEPALTPAVASAIAESELAAFSEMYEEQLTTPMIG